MKFSRTFSSIAVTGAILALAFAAPTLAADSSADWIKPASEGATTITNSLVSIAAAVLGLCIVIFGFWSAMTQRIEWHRLWIFVVVALLISAGPTAMTWLVDLFKQS